MDCNREAKAMDWWVTRGDLLAAPVEAAAVPIEEGDEPGALAGAVDAALDGRLSTWLKDTGFRGKVGTVRTVHTFGRGPVRFLTLVGTGSGAGDAQDGMRLFAARAARSARDAGATSLALALPGTLPVVEAARAVAEGVLLGTYTFTRLKSAPPRDRRLTTVHLVVPAGQEEQARAGIAAGEAVATGVALARDLVNQPGADLWPDRLAALAATVATEAGLTCRSFGGEELATMGAGALLGVGRGSDHPPRLIHLRYRPEGVDGSAPIAFVGKGITFDTGGYNLKPGAGMETMKVDMAGAAAVLGAMRALAALRPAVAIDAVIASAENMVSGRSMRPGDVLTAMNGTTIEVNNTDAEGRLVLADAVTYAIRQGARQIVDLATLTGACVVALGSVCTGVMGAPQATVDELLSAAARAGERMWQLPLYDEYREVLRSEVADMRNSGGRNAGAQVGAVFIREFAGTTPWVHLDIAGTAWTDKDTTLAVKGATGVGVRTLVALAEAAAAPTTA
jgi:leucyl aminopeptidase